MCTPFLKQTSSQCRLPPLRPCDTVLCGFSSFVFSLWEPQISARVPGDFLALDSWELGQEGSSLPLPIRRWAHLRLPKLWGE